MSESTRSRNNNSETIVHEEIINLIESPELREHLLHNPQILSDDHYSQIIGGASIEINRKREMLSRLVAAERSSSDLYRLHRWLLERAKGRRRKQKGAAY